MRPRDKCVLYQKGSPNRQFSKQQFKPHFGVNQDPDAVYQFMRGVLIKAEGRGSLFFGNLGRFLQRKEQKCIITNEKTLFLKCFTREVNPMTQMEVVYDYLCRNYKENEPIFLSEISIPNVKEASVRLQLKKLTADGRVKRFDTGIYYIPQKSMFRFGSMLSVDDVIRKKYLTDGGSSCGYISGLLFANQLGLTTQVPMAYEVYTNKATTDYRDTMLGNMRIIVRRPYVEVNDRNVSILQFLDLLKEVDDVSELTGVPLTERLLKYMKANGLDFADLQKYLPYYPDRIYRNMYEVGFLNGVVA